MHGRLRAGLLLFLMGYQLAETLNIIVLPAQEYGRLDQDWIFIRESRCQALKNEEYHEHLWII